MYFKVIFVLVLFCISGFIGFGQSLTIEWEKKTGKQGLDEFDCIIEDLNGGYSVVGAGHSGDKQDLDFWHIRFANDGAVISEKFYGTDENDLSSDISQFSNGEYIIVGKTISNNLVNNMLLVKADIDGNEVWQKSLNTGENIEARNVTTMDDGSFIVTGTKVLSEKNKKIWIARFDSVGEIVWEKIFGEEGIAEAESTKKLPDGGFAVAGRVSQTNILDANLWVFRFDKDGNILWDRQFESPNINVWPECICCTADNNLMVVGWYGSCMNDINSENPIFDYDLFLSKISPDGKTVWSKNIDSEGSEGGNAVVVRPDGKILIAGKKETSFMGRVGTWLLVADQEGEILTETVLSYNFENDKATKIINCSDGGFIVIGPGEIDLNQRNSDGWIKKFKAF